MTDALPCFFACSTSVFSWSLRRILLFWRRLIVERFGTQERPLRIAVIGAGPSGFYTIEALLKHTERAMTIDLFDRLPTPYGLVRYGVAPDHPSIKAVTRVFEKMLADPR